MKPSMKLAVAILLTELLALATIEISFCNGSAYVGCIESERKALLRFKQDLKDPSKRLASWSNNDGSCCTWVGVVCNNSTGRVLELHLGKSKLIGKINPSLLQLRHLVYLNLSSNNFEGTGNIPGFLGSMRNLRYIDLSNSGFTGMIPRQLGNLSNLQYLDLSRNNDYYYYFPNSLYLENFSWLSGLSRLKHLDLSGLNLSRASDWPLVIDMLPSLLVLKLSDCSLPHLPHDLLPIANFSSLTTLHLSYNTFDKSLVPSWVFGLSRLVFLDLSNDNFQGSIPDGLQNLTCLRHLDLSNNHFSSSLPSWLYKFRRLEYLSFALNSLQGTISSALENLTSLRELDLSFNKIEGGIPRSSSRLCNLRFISFFNAKLNQEISEFLDIFIGCVSDVIELIDLRYNQLSGHLTNQLGKFKNLNILLLDNNMITGHIPSSLGKLSSLKCVFLRNNKFNGTLSEVHFANLTSLIYFYASGNSLTVKVSPFWVPPFKLQVLGLSSCHLGSQFPSWLDSQKDLIILDISNSGIVDTIPSRFWKSHHSLLSLNLSLNQIHGQLPILSEATQLRSLDLHSNNLSGSLPFIPLSVWALDFSSNAFTGSMFHFLCDERNESEYSMQILNLRHNFLSGEIPDCWMNWQRLTVLNLGNNEFSGTIPASMGTLLILKSLRLGHNNLSGPIPVSLKNCTNLVAFDIGENGLSENVPAWIGEGFSTMMILKLQSNKFHGQIPEELCRLSSLQILDISHNNLFGTIPRCINNLTAMVNLSTSTETDIEYGYDYFSNPFVENEIIVIKGNVFEYSTILKLVRSMDLSRNDLSGDIPVEMTNLVALQSLNLSHNSFTGKIPENIGAMRSLESIDFSGNQLSGRIPQSISSLSFVSHLNLSNNNLTGKIPSSSQLQSFEASCFVGNDLCGLPLPTKCTQNVLISEDANGNEDEEGAGEVDYWLYVSMAFGFVVGFWCVIGLLFLNTRWGYKYSHFLDCIIHKLGWL